MGNKYKSYIYNFALFVILSASSAISATEWLPYQETLRPQTGTSLNKPSLSPAIKISKPDINLPENIAFFSGVWSGAICNGFSEAIIAVTELTAASASVTYSLGNYRGLFNNQEYNAKIVDGELIGRTKTGFEVILGKRTSDKHLNIKWLVGDDTQQSADTRPRICYGVLKREK